MRLLFDSVHGTRTRHDKVSDMTNRHDTLEERGARLDIRIKRYQEAAKRRLISHGNAVWTRAEIEDTIARDAKPPSGRTN